MTEATDLMLPIASKILLVDDDPTPTQYLKQLLAGEGYQVDTAHSGETAIEQLKQFSYKVLISDLNMPGISGMGLLDYCKENFPEMQVIILTAYGTIQSAVQALKTGAFDYLTKPVQLEELNIVLKKALAFERLKIRHDFLSQEFEKKEKFLYQSNNPAFQKILEIVDEIKDVGTTVLLQGESGTGKEVIARLIHKSSLRASSNFVSINCGAIPESLIESELFGYDKGAFTDAKSNSKGKLEFADGGTVFLDEINELSPKGQVALLRFLQEKEIVPLGSYRKITVNVRIIVATNKNLRALIQDGNFREDLYYRISVFPINLPPLNERREDIVPLAHWFIDKFKREYSKPADSLSEDARKVLLNYSWPGNIRELQNCIERATILSKGKVIEDDVFLMPIPEQSAPLNFENIGLLPLKDLETAYILWALEKMDGNKNQTANQLGISPRGLRYKLKP
ncbi:MAG: sigma-54-dependent Fis family transcriptional regulator [SAR324 cluster bacterium]|nr:sigma-54-dependent Fis family transcriptional regulator [SAR324 cluster bacterium]